MIRSMILFPTLVFLIAVEAGAGEWSYPVVVRRRAEPVVTYRAMLDGDFLVVEAKHTEGWHTYALDNIERARERTGKNRPETELPTRIKVAGGLKIAGNWYQTRPENLSQEAIRWYTWGFNERALFAVRVERVEGAEAQIIVNAQACDASACQMVQGVVLKLLLSTNETEANPNKAIDVSKLVEVATAEPEKDPDSK